MPKLANTPLYEWFKKATADERQKMAELVGVTVLYIRSISYGYRLAPWALALRMAWAARKVRESGDGEVQGRLPDVQRGDVSPFCRGCPFYQACKEVGMREGIEEAK